MLTDAYVLHHFADVINNMHQVFVNVHMYVLTYVHMYVVYVHYAPLCLHID